MNSKRILWAIATFVALTSCSKEKSADAPDVNPRAQFTAGILTRASGNSWATDDAIGVYMKIGGQGLSTASIAEKVENYKHVTRAGDGVFMGETQAQVAYFPVDGSAVDFIAYYPYKENIQDYTYPIDVTSQSNHPAIDVLYSDNAKNKTKAAPQVALNFTHRLVNLVVTLTAGEGLTTANLTNATVSITGQKTQGTMALATGIVTPSTTQSAAQTVNLKMTGTNGAAIILPATATTGRKLVMTISTGEVFEWEIPSTTTFNGGNKYIYNVTLNRTEVKVSSTITDWTAGNGSGSDVDAGQPNA